MIKACKYKICFIVTKLIKGAHHKFYTWISVYGHKKLYLAGEMWQTIYFVTLKHAFEHLHTQKNPRYQATFWEKQDAVV